MFCEKCGTRLEAGDMFCPNCGNRVEANPAPQAAPAMAGHTPAMNMPTYSAGAGALASGGIDLKRIVLGVLMLIASFFPFINIKFHKLVETGAEYVSGLFSELSILEPYRKMNIYQIASTSSDLYIETKYRVLIYFVLIFILATIIITIASGVLRKKSLEKASGIMSAACFVAGIGYMIYMGVVVSKLNKEFIDFEGMEFDVIKGVHGFGLILMLILFAICAVLTFKNYKKN